MIEKCTCNRREKIDFSIKQRMNGCSLVQRHHQLQQYNNPTPEYHPISHSCPQLTTSSSQIHPANNNNYNCNCININYQQQEQQQPHHQHYLHHYHQQHQYNIGRQCMCAASGGDSLRHFSNKQNCSSIQPQSQPPYHWPSSTSTV
ncbi:ell-associated factor Eaf-like [Episyrphus balteatus]|uniref:ell-associated factor Eaf-like n=1 Tax=Episyrphus balteatus TaxID=286459 RepID=UPI002486A25A|nr:ell-associated factor Eaf-like [Episyrphus balteatus]